MLPRPACGGCPACPGPQPPCPGALVPWCPGAVRPLCPPPHSALNLPGGNVSAPLQSAQPSCGSCHLGQVPPRYFEASQTWAPSHDSAHLALAAQAVLQRLGGAWGPCPCGELWGRQAWRQSHGQVTRSVFWPCRLLRERLLPVRMNPCQQPALSLPFPVLPHCSAGPASRSLSSLSSHYHFAKTT